MCSIENGAFKPCGKDGCPSPQRQQTAIIPLGGTLVATPTQAEEELNIRIKVEQDQLIVWAQVGVAPDIREEEVLRIKRNMGVYLIIPGKAFFMNAHCAATLGKVIGQFMAGIL